MVWTVKAVGAASPTHTKDIDIQAISYNDAFDLPHEQVGDEWQPQQVKSA